MRVLLVGSGGREHALAWKLTQSEKLTKLYCAPGNAGISEIATCIPVKETEIEKLTTFAEDNMIDLVIVGPEVPLVAGLADKMREKSIPTFGPSKAAAEIEGSKAFMKDLLKEADVPTAFYGRFTNIDTATAFIKEKGAPIVVKTDGLAAGKGVIICDSEESAINAAQEMLSGESFGDAGKEIIIEEFLDGEEVSYFTLSDGKTYLHLTSAQDHKQVGDGDTGPNTGGMGAYSPAHMMNGVLEKEIIKTCIEPTLNVMKDKDMPFNGVLFSGLMLTPNGPKVLEYNVRFGDPECQALMLRLEGDLLEVLYAAATGTLEQARHEIGWSSNPSICVVMASKGYPGAYIKGTVIAGVDNLTSAQVFHAGTKKDNDGRLLSNGGRVLNICANGEDFQQAIDNAYKSIVNINWPDGFYRSDIGWRALKQHKNG